MLARMTRAPCWQRSLVGLVALILSLASAPARAQHPSFIEPYEVLYRKRQLLQGALNPDQMSPSAATLALVQARTETMLARLATVTPALGRAGSPKLQSWASSIKRHRSEAEVLRDRGKHYAAWWKASLDFVAAEFLSGLQEAVTRDASQDVPGGGATNRLTEVRARLEAFRTRLDTARVSSVSVGLALADAYSIWVDATSLLDLLQHRPADLMAMLDPFGIKISESQRELFVRIFMESLLVPVIQWSVEEAELALQASQADPVSLLRPDEAGVRAIARAYADAARANLTLARSQREGRRLPDRGADREFTGRLAGDMATQALNFERQRRADPGLQSAFLMLGTSRSAYATSLGELIETQVQLASEVAAAPNRESAEKEMDRLRMIRLFEIEKRDREAAAQARVVLGHVPAAIGLTYARGLELNEGDAEDRELALSEMIEAQTLAELAAGLGAPAPRDATPIDDSLAQDRAEFIRVCIGRLAYSMEGPAWSLVTKHNFKLSKEEFRDVFRGAVVKTCASARDLSSSAPRSLFLTVFKRQVLDWYRKVKIFERAAPKLTDICSMLPQPDQELLETEACSPTEQAMSTLSDQEREIIEWHEVEELTYEEIAQRLGIEKGTAEKRGQRALAKLRAAYKRLDPLSLNWPGPLGRWLWAALLAPHSAPLPAQSPCQSRT